MTNLPSIVRVEARPGHRLYLVFDDGVEGEVAVSDLVPFEGVLAPLRDEAVFGRVRVDSELGTIVWPNGADLDPLVLHARLSGRDPIGADPRS